MHNIGDSINTEGNEGDVYIAPDEKYLIVSSTRNGGLGWGDLYISYNKNEQWTKLKTLGPEINSEEDEYRPIVSPDGKYLFFTSFRNKDLISEKPKKYEDILKNLRNPLNGSGDIFWVPMEIVLK